MPHRYLRLALLLTVLLAPLTFAKDPPAPTTAPATKAPKLHYLSVTAVDVIQLLPAPPTPGSDEAKADLDAVLHAQETRTDAQVARGMAEHKLHMKAFAPVFGDWFTEGNLPLTTKLLDDAAKDSKSFTATGKEYFARKRPPNDARVKPKVQEDDELSYPSGHSTRGMLWGLILADASPARRDALLDRGHEIGYDRVLVGVHYPSDVFAGRVLGQALFNAMRSDPAYQRDLAAAKAELAEAEKKFSKR
jgi:acid phosphatase (class A)